MWWRKRKEMNGRIKEEKHEKCIFQRSKKKKKKKVWERKWECWIFHTQTFSSQKVLEKVGPEFADILSRRKKGREVERDEDDDDEEEDVHSTTPVQLW